GSAVCDGGCKPVRFSLPSPLSHILHRISHVTPPLPSRRSPMLLGAYCLDIVSGGPFRLDGGSMFGIIPKPLWERERPADDRNRIQLAANCPLIRGRGEVLLIDAGNGTKLSPKEQEIFALDPAITLTGSLAALG